MNTAKHWSADDWEKSKPEDMWPDYDSITREYNMLDSGVVIDPLEVLAWQQVGVWAKITK